MTTVIILLVPPYCLRISSLPRPGMMCRWSLNEFIHKDKGYEVWFLYDCAWQTIHPISSPQFLCRDHLPFPWNEINELRGERGKKHTLSGQFECPSLHKTQERKWRHLSSPRLTQTLVNESRRISHSQSTFGGRSWGGLRRRKWEEGNSRKRFGQEWEPVNPL